MKAFISYSHQDRAFGAQAKRVLEEVGINGFLAHEDLDVSEEWRERIVAELRECELFVPILSSRFLSSDWAPQEIGFVVSRNDVVVAPLSIDGTVPRGFIAHVQSRRIPEAGITRQLLVEPLAMRFPRVIVPGLIRLVAHAGSFRDAESKLRPLAPLFPVFSDEEAQALAEAAISNNQIWAAADCARQYLPEFIRVRGNGIQPRTRRALEYQISQQRWYPGDDKEAARGE